VPAYFGSGARFRGVAVARGRWDEGRASMRPTRVRKSQMVVVAGGCLAGEWRRIEGGAAREGEDGAS
jgi:hypothetical protein